MAQGHNYLQGHFPKWKRPDASIVPDIEPACLNLLEALLFDTLENIMCG
jgi:hypothetical protein